MRKARPPSRARKQRRRSKPAAGRWQAESLAEVAVFFGVSTATVKTWRQEQMPGEDAPWDLAAISRWKIARLQARQGPQGKKKNPRDLLEMFKARRERLRWLQDRDELVQRSEHEALVLQLIAAFKGGLERLSLTLGALTAGLSQEESTREHQLAFDRLLEELASNADFGDDADADADADTGDLDEGAPAGGQATAEVDAGSSLGPPAEGTPPG